jgi:hypothetical protein
MTWEDELGAGERREWDRFVAYQREHTVKAMEGSAFVMSLIPSEEAFDVKFAVETGMAIMLDKPILAIATPGAKIPPKMLLVADKVLYVDVDTEEGRRQVAEAISQLIEVANA